MSTHTQNLGDNSIVIDTSTSPLSKLRTKIIYLNSSSDEDSDYNIDSDISDDNAEPLALAQPSWDPSSCDDRGGMTRGNNEALDLDVDVVEDNG